MVVFRFVGCCKINISTQSSRQSMIPDFNTTAINNAVTSYTTLASSTSNSCDLLGTIQSLANEVVQDVVDEVTGAITSIKRSATEVAAEIKDKLSECFAGSSGILNDLKGYVNTAIAYVNEIKSNISHMVGEVREQIEAAVASIVVTINAVIGAATNAIQQAATAVGEVIASIQAKVAECVGGLKQSMCSTLNSFMAGAPDDALSNITSGSSSPAIKTLGAIKDIYNEGASSLSDVTESIVNSTGAGNTLGAASSSATNANAQLSSARLQVATLPNALSELQTINGALA